MRGSMDTDPLAIQIKLVRKYIKLKLIEDNVLFRGHDQERNHVYELLRRTVLQGESHSALLIGPRSSGKTTLLNSVLHQLSRETDLENDAIIIQLNGLVHSDDKLALKAITAQMQLENTVGERVFGTFAENLSFLLSCIQTGVDRRCRSMVFILDQCDMFCHSGISQTLLYNLFDVTHSQTAPMCVIGVTNRLDIMELFEKRVKSRFSHRHIFIFPNEVNDDDRYDIISPLEGRKRLFVELLSLPLEGSVSPRKKRKSRKSIVKTDETACSSTVFAIPEHILKGKLDEQCLSTMDQAFVSDWNAHIRSLIENEKVIDALEKLCYYTVDEQTFRNVLFEIISKLSPTKPNINVTDLTTAIDNAVAPEHRVKVLQSLSILELSLVIAMKHGMEIFDGQPMNFEMILHRYTKFANEHSSSQSVPRPVILKAFEHLQALEIVLPARTSDVGGAAGDASSSRVQKEYKLYTLAVPAEDLGRAVDTFRSLPTEICHWYSNSVV
ncbi:origin recognition complex subunit 4 [Bombyx mandarina]|uniref:Origin recognition complex subunit 4 n=1 Tax=Bombyx mandarina TaxID=7092 RepID=A0A6J2JGP3_BOMMA|nr:origin recognition complex subunit 4 [Bombyx mandarina]